MRSISRRRLRNGSPGSRGAEGLIRSTAPPDLPPRPRHTPHLLLLAAEDKRVTVAQRRLQPSSAISFVDPVGIPCPRLIFAAPRQTRRYSAPSSGQAWTGMCAAHPPPAGSRTGCWRNVLAGKQTVPRSGLQQRRQMIIYSVVDLCPVPEVPTIYRCARSFAAPGPGLTAGWPQ